MTFVLAGVIIILGVRLGRTTARTRVLLLRVNKLEADNRDHFTQRINVARTFAEQAGRIDVLVPDVANAAHDMAVATRRLNNLTDRRATGEGAPVALIGLST